MKKYTYPAIRYTHKVWKSLKLVTFYCFVEELHEWCGVYRKGIIGLEGYQRILKTDHAQKITEFLMNNPENVIPNSIVIAFNDSLKNCGEEKESAEFITSKRFKSINKKIDEELYDLNDFILESGELEVNISPKIDLDKVSVDYRDKNEQKLSQYWSAYIIDGQHRVNGGMGATSPVFYPVTALMGISSEEQAFHFIVINRQPKRVTKHDIDAVVPKAIYENLQERLVGAGIRITDADIVYYLDQGDSNSPFYESINWKNNPNPNAPISKGAIDKLIKLVRQLPEEIVELFGGDEGALITSVWNGVKTHLLEFWYDKDYVEAGGKETYKNQLLIKAAGVFPAIQKTINKVANAGTIYIKDEKNKEISLSDSVARYFSKCPPEVWYCEWKHSSITNDDRQNSLADELIKVIRKKRIDYGKSPWFDPPISNEAKQAEKEKEKAKKRAAKKAIADKKKAAAAAKKQAAADKKKAAAAAKKKAMLDAKKS